jgi:hypothetical protein
MEDDFTRETSPAGDLAKPPRKPPTALGIATPLNPDRHRPRSGASIRRHWFSKLLSDTLDVLDVAGDAVAEALQLRPRH